MNYRTTVTVQSKIAPDIAYVIRRLSAPARFDIEMENLSILQRQQECRAMYPPVTSEETKLYSQLNLANQAMKRISPDDTEAVDRLVVEVGEIQRALGAVVPQDVAKARAPLDVELQRLVNKEKPAYVRAALISVSGLEFDGAPVTPESFLKSAPSELFDEVYGFIMEHASLTQEEAKNSLSLTNSVEVPRQATSSTVGTAETVEPKPSTSVMSATV